MVELEFVRTYDAPRQLVWDDGFPDGSVKSTATATFTEVDASTTRLTVHLVADFSDTVRAGAERGRFGRSRGTNFIISSCRAASGGIVGRSTHFKASGSGMPRLKSGGKASPQYTQ